MRAASIFFLALLLLLSVAGCELVYKLPTRQGNVIEQKEIDKVEVGMTREQVRFLLGTPIAASSFRDDRWDYYGYYKPPRGKPFSRTVSLWFDGDKLARMEGEKDQGAGDTPDIEAMKAEKKAADDERREPEQKDGIIQPPDQQEHKDGGSD